MDEQEIAAVNESSDEIRRLPFLKAATASKLCASVNRKDFDSKNQVAAFFKHQIQSKNGK